tara:strand:+ start:5024 stop:5446 length:423 start_codon:yes stop_codon:yes gene_type:complete
MTHDSRYHPEWETISRYVRELFNYYCARCGINCRNIKKNKNLLQVHHIDENPSNNDLENLIPLCASCHLKIEGEARLHAPYREKQLEMFENKTYFTQMLEMRNTAIAKYGIQVNSDKYKNDIEAYEKSLLEWEDTDLYNF